MSFLTLEHVRISLGYMAKHTHPTLMSVLALSRSGGVESADSSASVPYGSVNERKLLTDYFSPIGGPEDRPYFVPFGSGRGVTHWRDANYAGRSLQRQRTDRKTIFRQDAGNNRRWTFEPGFISEIQKSPSESLGDIPVSVAHLSVWCFRKRELNSVSEIVEAFIAEFRIRETNMLGPLFTDKIPNELSSIQLQQEPIDGGELLQLLATFEPEREEDDQTENESLADMSSLPEKPSI